MRSGKFCESEVSRILGDTNILKAHWQAIARSVGTDVGSSDNLTIIGKSGSSRARYLLSVPME
ncbi:hypothetical protein [Sphingobacterium hotanense]|uniref:hypothetical protein n=1 Tax=Sphingobacterium hotanense TaxID=649196 RepID=UPI0021A2E261|nr:hypothetical protein [Sphingobacterium hotanense]MCT1525687.1 hypothetical protein [Sphingobacterium hotanense]